MPPSSRHARARPCPLDDNETLAAPASNLAQTYSNCLSSSHLGSILSVATQSWWFVLRMETMRRRTRRCGLEMEIMAEYHIK